MKTISEIQIELIKRGYDTDLVLSEDVKLLIEIAWYKRGLKLARRYAGQGEKKAVDTLTKQISTTTNQDRAKQLINRLDKVRQGYNEPKRKILKGADFVLNDPTLPAPTLKRLIGMS